MQEKDRLFGLVASQWMLPHKPGWKENWVKEAEKYPDLENARRILELGAGRQ